MKILYTFLMAFGMIMSANAQDTAFPLQFADSEGNMIADGTVLDITRYEDDGFGVMMPSGVFVRNTTDADVYAGGIYIISRMDNGVFQTCFPQNCEIKETTGNYETVVGVVSAGSLHNMQTEWLPEAEGSCLVGYQLVTYRRLLGGNSYKQNEMGPAVGLHFTYDPASIDNTDTDGLVLKSVEYRTLDGRRTSSPSHGVFVVKQKYMNGATKTTKQLFK